MATAVVSIAGIVGCGSSNDPTITGQSADSVDLDPHGLRAEYFSSQDLTGAPVSRLDPTVDFDWGRGSPLPGLPADGFSARWSGTVTPSFSESYVLHVTADDGVRLFIDGKRVVDDWTQHAARTSDATLRLEAGRAYAIQLEYFEAKGGASVTLQWSSPHTARAVIPATAFRPANALAGIGILRANGRQFVDATGKVIPLRGVNLGTWLLLEGWMTEFPKGMTDSAARTMMDDVFSSTPNASQRLMDTYQQHFITEADFTQMHALGINLVRLPFYYRLFESDSAPGVYRPEAFALLDQTLQAARRHGVYVFLDFHGVEGGQSANGTTGEARPGGAELWTDADAQRRYLALWKAIATRYRDLDVVAGYDLINEPADNNKAVTTDTLVHLYDRAMTAIRSVEGPQPHLVAVERIQNHCNFSEPPTAASLALMKTWTQWVQSDHLYTQWCGPYRGTTAALVPDSYLDEQVKHLTDLQDGWGVQVPVFVGEFGVGSDDAFSLLPRQVERFNTAGYAWTAWSYKTWSPTNFGVVYPADPDATGKPLCGAHGMHCPVFASGTSFDDAQSFLGLLDSKAPELRLVVNPGYRQLFNDHGAFAAP